MPSTRGITLQPYVQDRYVAGAMEGYRWRVEVVEARDMPTAVFLYKKVATKLYNADTGGAEPPEEIEWAGQFNGVASAADLEDYPEGEPAVNDFPPFYRLDWVDQVFLSRHQAELAYQALLRAVDMLRETMDIMDNLAPQEPVIFGPPPG